MQVSTAYSDVTSDVRCIELMKWIGLVAMLVEHVAHFALGWSNGWPFVVGRLAFPLFTVALALGCAHKTVPELRSIVVRLVGWGAVAGLVGGLVRDPVPLNVLFTFALGVMLHATLRDTGRWRFFVLLVVALLSMVVEYGPLGVAAVACAMHAARRDGRWEQGGWMLFSLLLVCCVKFNEPALVAIPVVFGLLVLRLDVRRTRGVFYWAYVGQWPVIALMRSLS